MACLMPRAGPVRRALPSPRPGSRFSAPARAVLSHLRPHLVAAVRRLLRCGGTYLALQTAPTPCFVVVEEDAHGSARLQPQSASAADGAGALTGREVEVMAMLADGYSSTQMARLLGCSARTVDKHVEHIRLKLGVTSRLQAVSRWRSAAIVAPP